MPLPHLRVPAPGSKGILARIIHATGRPYQANRLSAGTSVADYGYSRCAVCSWPAGGLRSYGTALRPRSGLPNEQSGISLQSYSPNPPSHPAARDFIRRSSWMSTKTFVFPATFSGGGDLPEWPGAAHLQAKRSERGTLSPAAVSYTHLRAHET